MTFMMCVPAISSMSTCWLSPVYQPTSCCSQVLYIAWHGMAKAIFSADILAYPCCKTYGCVPHCMHSSRAQASQQSKQVLHAWTAAMCCLVHISPVLSSAEPKGSTAYVQAARAYDAAAIVIRGPAARTNYTYPMQLLHVKSKKGKVQTSAHTSYPFLCSCLVHISLRRLYTV